MRIVAALALAAALLVLTGCQATDDLADQPGVHLVYVGPVPGSADPANPDKPLPPRLRFVLRNNTDQPVSFLGQSLTQPLYQIKRIDGPNPGQVASSMTASGIKRVTLPPGNATHFHLPKNFDQPGRYELEIWVTTPGVEEEGAMKAPFTLAP